MRGLNAWFGDFPLGWSLRLSVILLLGSTVSVVAQQRCGSVEYAQQRNQLYTLESDLQFENWLNEKKVANEKARNAESMHSALYRMQVVVHIIHNGEAEGVGLNLSNEQVASQIDVLNKDFSRLNEDASNTPAEFQSLAGFNFFEFSLATTDPSGNPTTGINRVEGTKTSWTIADDEELKAESYWPAENYINIWVCDLRGSFGYTQFPISTLPGLENSSKNRLTDGIVISYQAFGSVDDGPFVLNSQLNKGRTATHEMGHFLGLRHIWGDKDNCEGTDYVDDTPPQEKATTGCPSHPQKECPSENPESKMFQNFMDYTNDACMNLFTQEQAGRMTLVLLNSPRRASLLVPLSTEQPESSFPKLFSPNRDGVNDFWLWTNPQDYGGCSLFIYNRFGKLVYTATSYDNTWDGRTNDGQLLEAEAYYYVIQCEGRKEISGGVRIIR